MAATGNSFSLWERVRVRVKPRAPSRLATGASSLNTLVQLRFEERFVLA